MKLQVGKHLVVGCLFLKGWFQIGDASRDRSVGSQGSWEIQHHHLSIAPRHWTMCGGEDGKQLWKILIPLTLLSFFVVSNCENKARVLRKRVLLFFFSAAFNPPSQDVGQWQQPCREPRRQQPGATGHSPAFTRLHRAFLTSLHDLLRKPCAPLSSDCRTVCTRECSSICSSAALFLFCSQETQGKILIPLMQKTK